MSEQINGEQKINGLYREIWSNLQRYSTLREVEWSALLVSVAC